jgi:hypothetical protein
MKISNKWLNINGRNKKELKKYNFVSEEEEKYAIFLQQHE